jgi:hypothetical protein
MDPASFAIFVKELAPVLGALIVLGIPAVIVFTVKHFKLRHRELELEAELHGKNTQTRLAAIEARLGTLETALGALVRSPSPASLQDRMSMLEPRASSAEAPAPAEPDPQRQRTR